MRRPQRRNRAPFTPVTRSAGAIGGHVHALNALGASRLRPDGLALGLGNCELCAALGAQCARQLSAFLFRHLLCGGELGACFCER
eukprot:scaffold187707_cov28-Tisochrysis_lutea.AAC.3